MLKGIKKLETVIIIILIILIEDLSWYFRIKYRKVIILNIDASGTMKRPLAKNKLNKSLLVILISGLMNPI